jgi:secondary thiamine-phosphate synthase enzyme
MHYREDIAVATPGRGFVDITAEVMAVVGRSGLAEGLCNVFICHTSASLILCENADPAVRRDLERLMSHLAPDGDPRVRAQPRGL